MYDFKYENQGTNSYLVYAFKAEDQIDSMGLGMIINNIIPGFAPCVFTQQNSTKYLKYNITAKISVKQFLANSVNKKRLTGVFNGIMDAIINSEDYMINPDNLVLDLNYMYSDVSTCETVLVCIPVIRYNSEAVSLKSFFKDIMFSTRFDQTENCDYVAKIINYLNLSADFSPVEFKQLLDSINNNEPSKPAVDAKKVTPEKTSDKDKKAASTGGTASTVGTVQPNIKPTYSPPVSPRSNNTNPVSFVQPPVFATPPVNGRNIASGKGMVSAEIPTDDYYANKADKKSKKKKKSAPQPSVPADVQADAGEKPMSMFYLLQHYNKQNAAKYKAQKAKKKMQQGNPQALPQAQPQFQPQVQPQFQPQVQPQFQPQVQPQFQPQVQPQFQPQVQPQPNIKKATNSFAVPGHDDQLQNQGFSPVRQPAKPQNGMSFGVNTVPPTVMPTQPNHALSQGYKPNASFNEVSDDFGPTTVLGGNDDGMTAVLNEYPAGNVAPPKKPYIIRVRNNERIPVDKPVFRIGKEKSFVDYFIGDNTYISRGHANIIQKDGKYYIVDNNSRNHTYVNGDFITSNIEVELHSGDTFRLANEDFEFKLF